MIVVELRLGPPAQPSTRAFLFFIVYACVLLPISPIVTTSVQQWSHWQQQLLPEAPALSSLCPGVWPQAKVTPPGQTPFCWAATLPLRVQQGKALVKETVTV